MAASNELPAEGFVRERDVLRVFPVKRSTWYRGIEKGYYPKPVRLSMRTSAWRVEDIRDLIKRAEMGELAGLNTNER